MKFALVALAVLVSACSSRNPTQPDAAVFDEAVPFTLSVNATAGTGPTGGTASIVARVQNGHGTNLPNVMVAFKTDVGTLSSASAATLSDGTVTLSLTAATAATITATAGTLTAHALVQSNPNVPIVPPVPDGPAPPPPGPPAPGALTVTLLVTPGVTGTATTFGLQSSGISRAVWTFGDGASVTTTAPSASHVYTAAGRYTASVTITDTIGRTASNSQTFTITDAPPPPPPPGPSYTVTLTATPSSVVAGDDATLTAKVTLDNGALAPTSYAWDCDGSSATAAVTTGTNTFMCTYPTPGAAMPSTVTVTGGTATGTGSTTVAVAAFAPLFVNVAVDNPKPPIGTTLTFTGTVTSSRALPSLLQWEWDFDNTATSVYTRTESSASPHPTTLINGYGNAGVKTIKVRVTDSATGRQATGTTTVTVQ